MFFLELLNQYIGLITVLLGFGGWILYNYLAPKFGSKKEIQELKDSIKQLTEQNKKISKQNEALTSDLQVRRGSVNHKIEKVEDDFAKLRENIQKAFEGHKEGIRKEIEDYKEVIQHYQSSVESNFRELKNKVEKAQKDNADSREFMGRMDERLKNMESNITSLLEIIKKNLVKGVD